MTSFKNRDLLTKSKRGKSFHFPLISMLVVTANKDFHVFNATIFKNNVLFLSATICFKVGVLFRVVIFFGGAFVLSGVVFNGVVCFNGNDLL